MNKWGHTAVKLHKCYSIKQGRDCKSAKIINRKCVYQTKSLDKKLNICTNNLVISQLEEEAVYLGDKIISKDGVK